MNENQPTTLPLRRTRSVLVALLVALALMAVACGDDSADDGGDAAVSTGDTGGAEPAADEAVPDADTDTILITHKYGEVTVPADPQRVVSVGFSDQDDLLALGVVPVGIRDWYGDQPHAVWPWATDALGDAEPVVLSNLELNFEAIAALEPDLIIGVSSGMTADDYELLSAIAPTVAQSGDFADFAMPWQDRTRLIGTAVGEPELADELVGEIEETIAAAAADYPEFSGASAAVAFVFEDGPGAYASTDVRSRIMTDLGFVIPLEYDELADGRFYASFSAEEIDLLEVDVVAWLTGSDEELEGILGSPLRAGFAPAAEGREVFIDQLYSGAFSFASTLSLGFMLDFLVPELALAVDGDPATAVPSAVDVGAAPSGGDATGGAPQTDEAAAMEALALVFDSSVPFADKVAHLEDAPGLEESSELYRAAADGLGGIVLEPTAAVIDGDVATVTYDVLFGGVAAYEDLDRDLTLVDGVWTVSREQFCGFLASSRVTCV